MPQTCEHVLLARQVGVPYIVVVEQGRHGRRRRASNWSSSRFELLSEYEPGDDALSFASALKALEGDEACKRRSELMDACDAPIPEPVRELDKPFLMPIEDVFTITGRGTVASARSSRARSTPVTISRSSG
jgi:elongation factor Tu